MSECKTPETMFRIRTSGNKVFYEIELPEGMEIPEEISIELENKLHDAVEEVLKQLFKKG